MKLANVCAVLVLLILTGCATIDREKRGAESTLQPGRSSEQPEPVPAGPRGFTYDFEYRGEEEWECERSTVKPSVVVDAKKGIPMDKIPEWCSATEAPEELVMDLADLFSSKIDFLTDIHGGDRFTVYFQKWSDNGHRTSYGPVLAVRMVIGGKEHSAFYYELPDGYAGYFDENGESLERLFLKSPLNYRRITSRFTLRRVHPILKVPRPHFGIDYAAPEGTPVNAIGSGIVSYRGWKKGFGRYVEIKHRRSYRSAYGHLSRFEDGLRKGRRVKANEVIGYVGQSGLATGAHLDFRLYRHGKPIDFLELESPPRRKVPSSKRSDFSTRYEFYLSALQVE
jgi:murein DD-endopeptidase MepM/ murein hydrolase activator NlpD